MCTRLPSTAHYLTAAHYCSLLPTRLDPEFDAGEAGGYRDILLNLRLVQPTGLGFTFEVQINTADFLQIKDDDRGGHKAVKAGGIRTHAAES